MKGLFFYIKLFLLVKKRFVFQDLETFELEI